MIRLKYGISIQNRNFNQWTNKNHTLKYFFFIFLLNVLLASTYYDQNIYPGNVYIDIPCERDTSVNFYSHAKLNWIDSVGGSSTYEFVEGDLNYLELSITKKCETKDGSSHEIILVAINPHNHADLIEIDPANTTWLIRSTWHYPPFEKNFSGVLDLENHTLEFYPRVDLSRNVLLAGKVIKTELLTRPESE